MPFYTPLRYPGGKRRLATAVKRLLEKNSLHDVHYVEPYAGGAAIALSLVFEEYASVAHINDLSRAVYAFWHSALHDTIDLCRRIRSVSVTMKEWTKQRVVYDARDTADLSDLGFSTLFLNRTNRSGIIAGGVIGGQQQTGKWSIDARFNKDEIIERIQKIGRYASRIHIYQRDALEFATEILPKLGKNAFAFFDPPYIENGRQLYLNNYALDNHREIARRVSKLKAPWVVTYDHAALRHGLYQHRHMIYGLPYSAQARYEGQEVMFFSDSLSLPTAWRSSSKFDLSEPKSSYPFYGIMGTMKPHPKMDEGPRAGKRFLKALGTVLAAPKNSIPNPFNKTAQKRKKPASRRG